MIEFHLYPAEIIRMKNLLIILLTLCSLSSFANHPYSTIECRNDGEISRQVPVTELIPVCGAIETVEKNLDTLFVDVTLRRSNGQAHVGEDVMVSIFSSGVINSGCTFESSCMVLCGRTNEKGIATCCLIAPPEQSMAGINFNFIFSQERNQTVTGSCTTR